MKLVVENEIHLKLVVKWAIFPKKKQSGGFKEDADDVFLQSWPTPWKTPISLRVQSEPKRESNSYLIHL